LETRKTTSPERVELAPGYSIATIINGCWQLTPDHGGGPGSEKDIHRVFADLVDHGFTTFDCADIYVGVEETIGRFRRTLSDPHQIQIHTKYAPNKDTLHLLTAQDVDKAVDRSLMRLGVDRLDLLQFHWWDYEVPGQDMMVDRLQRAQRVGKIRLLGVTNYDTAHVRALVDGGTELISIQVQYSLLDRRPEKKMPVFCEEKAMHILPYGVLAGGFLSERYLGQAAPETHDRSMNRSLQKYRLIIDEVGGWDIYQSLLSTLHDIARKHEVHLTTIAARWVLDQPSVPAIILGVGSTSRAAQNVSIGRLHLDDDDHAQIAARLATHSVIPGDPYGIERDVAGRHARLIKTNLHDEDLHK
jgi:aryl-alcohol dehydrogenase-like predicted oxidoreductase